MAGQPRRFYEFGPFRLDPQKLRLLRNGEVVPLSRKDIETLLVLVQHQGQTLTREDLLRKIWAEAFVEDANLTVAISHLRKALEQDSETHGYIETIPRLGYCFTGEVQETCEEIPPLIVKKFTHATTVIEEEVTSDGQFQAINATSSSGHLVRGNVSAISIRKTVLVAGLASLALILAVVSYLRTGRSATTGPLGSIRSIAVLPPKSNDSESETDYLSHGFADSVVTKLTALRRITVRPMSATNRDWSRSMDAVEIGRKLSVDAIVEGDLRRDNGKTRMTLRLVDVRSSQQIWTGYFEVEATEILKLSDAVSQELASALSWHLSSSEQLVLARRPTTKHDAYVAYLKGNYYWSKRGTETDKSTEHYRRAIELDPNFAEAYVGLANVHATRADWLEARMLIDKALALNNSLSEAHSTLGFIKMFHEWDWAGAERSLDDAIRLNPDSVQAHHWKGVYFSLRRQLDLAKAEMNRALELDPLSLIITADIGQLHYFAREYDQAIEVCNRALSLDQNFVIAHQYLSHAYYKKGMSQESMEEGILASRLVLSKVEEEYVRKLYARSGDRAVQEYELRKATNHVSSAMGCLRLGNTELSLNHLDRALRERAFLLPFINVDPLFDDIRDDPRFQKIIQSIGL